MKFRYLYFFFIIAFAGANFMSFSSGPARSGNIDRTGSPLAGNNGNFCMDCHGGGNFDASVNIELLDGDTPLNAYVAGQSYTLRITVAAGSGTPGGYGFQSVILDENNQSAGTYGAPPTGTGVEALGGRDYFEHRSRRSENVYEIEWTAPDAGTGTLNVYASGVAVNSNGSNSGDSPAKNSLELIEEMGPTSTEDLFGSQLGVSILGNPVQENLHLDIDATDGFDGVFQLIAPSGKMVINQNQEIIQGQQYVSFDVSNLSAGLYYLRISNGKGQKVLPVIKK